MTVTAFIKQHSVLMYYVLAIAISWAAILLVVGPGGFLSTTGSSPNFVLAGMASLLGPTVAGLLLTGLVDGRAGFRDLWSRVRRWRVGVRWYAVALLTAPLVNAATLFALSLTSAEYVPDIVTANDRISPVLLGLVGGLAVSIFEELGWTGFAMPRILARHSVLSTGLVMGVLWGLWHLPLFAGNAASAAGFSPVLLMAALLFAWLVPYRVLMVWMYDHTESVLLVMLMHFPIVVGAYVFMDEGLAAQEAFASLVAYGVALWIVVGVVALSDRWRLTLHHQVPPPREGSRPDPDRRNR
jgi:membrane protease YdiL (CAAX protease family)